MQITSWHSVVDEDALKIRSKKLFSVSMHLKQDVALIHALKIVVNHENAITKLRRCINFTTENKSGDFFVLTTRKS